VERNAVRWNPDGPEGFSIDTALGLLGVAALIAATAFFVAAEFAFVAVDRNRVEREAAEGSRRAQSLLGLLRRLSFQLSGAQLGITIAAVVLGFIAEPAVAAVIEPGLESLVGEAAAKPVSVIVALGIATVFTMVVGELVPKNIAIARPDATARIMAGPFRVYGWLARPIISVSDRAGDWLTRRLGVEPAQELKKLPSLHDLEALVQSSAAGGTLGAEEVTLLTRSLRFGEKSADDVMVPRPDVETLDTDASVADLVALSAETGLSRFPIVRGDLDRVAGVVHVKSALAVDPVARELTPVTALPHEVLAVPETRDLVSIMSDMRERHLAMAVVVDEHGGTAGIVSLEDLIEEIVGEIDDEYDDVTELTVVEDEGIYVLSGGMHHDEVRDACGFAYPQGNYETLAGFVLDRLQRVPTTGEMLRHDGWRVEVLDMDRQRIATLRLHEPWTSVQARLRRGREGTR
jgi:CBS domain containing-hemolysin-like protein